MAAFRLFTPLDDFRGLTNQALSDGYLKFFEAGTSTPADVYGEEALETNNGSTIQLDASARPNVDVWGDAAVAYDVKLYASDDSLQGTATNVKPPGGGGATLPDPVDGQFITSDGVVFLMDAILQLPDPAGQDGKILGVVGGAWVPIPKPADGADGTSDTSDTSTSFKVGSFLGQTGNDTAPSSGNKTTTKTVTFDKAYDAAPGYIGISPRTGGPTPSGVFPSWAVTAKSASTFTVTFDTTTGGTSADNQSGSDITSTIVFDYFALGVRAAA